MADDARQHGKGIKRSVEDHQYWKTLVIHLSNHFLLRMIDILSEFK